MLNNNIVDFYESQLGTYDKVNSHFEIYYREFSGWIEKYLNSEHPAIADLGCGTGTLSRLLTERGHVAYGVDISNKLIKTAIAKAHRNFFPIRSDISNLPIKNNSFDGAVCFGVLDQLDDVNMVIDEVLRILHSGGLFLFDISPFPTFDFWYFLGLYRWQGFVSATNGLFKNRIKFDWSIKDDNNESKTINIFRYKPAYIEKMLQKKGFKVMGKRGFHISKMFIPEKIHVDGRSEILSKIDHACWRLDNYLNRFDGLQNYSLYLMYAAMKKS